MREEFAIIKLPEQVKLPDNDSISQGLQLFPYTPPLFHLPSNDKDDLNCASNTVHSYIAGECDTLSIEWWYYLRVVQLILESKKLD